MSRKRSGVHKSYPRYDSQRKHDVMGKVVYYWNEAIELRDKDLEQAKDHIGHLKEDVIAKSEELWAAKSDLSKLQTHVREVDERCKSMKEEQNIKSRQNEDLSIEVQSLLDKLTESEARTANTDGKYKQYKKKINQTISEQQELYKRSKDHYNNVLQELKLAEQRKVNKANEVDSALETSRQKREELREAFKEFRESTFKEVDQKAKEITRLRNEMSGQQEALQREKLERQGLEVQLERAQEGNAQIVFNVNKNLDRLTELWQKTSDQHEKRSSDMDVLSERLKTACEALESRSEERVQIEDVSSLIIDLEERLIQRLLPNVETLLAQQSDTQASICNFGRSFEAQLTGVKGAMKHYVDMKGDRDFAQEGLISNISQVVQDLQDRMRSTRGVGDEIQEQMKNWTTEQIDALKKAHATHEDKLMQRLQDRFADINTREKQFKQCVENFTSHIERVRESSSSQEIERYVEQAVTLFKGALDANLLKEREWLVEKLHQNEDTFSNLYDLIRDAEPVDNAKVRNLQRELEGERAAVSRLTDEIQILREKVIASEDLHRRWTQHIQYVDSLRAKLAAAHRRMPRIEGIAAKLDSINRFNSLVHSTASYLSEEKSWIKNELEVTVQSNISQETEPARVHKGLFDYTVPTNGQELESIQDKRRVFVRSPAQESEIQSPPPNVEQERRRRMGSAKPRSIMRPSIRAGSPQTTNPERPSSQRLPTFESPVVASQCKQKSQAAVPDSVSNTQSLNGKGITNTLHNLFISGVRGVQSAFITVDEYQEESKHFRESVSGGPYSPDGQQFVTPTEDIHRISERFMESKDTSSCDGGHQEKSSKRTACNPADLSRPRVKRTYGGRKGAHSQWL